MSGDSFSCLSLAEERECNWHVVGYYYVLGILGALHMLTNWNLTKSYKIGTTIPVLQRKKLRYSGIEGLIKVTAEKWWHWACGTHSRAFSGKPNWSVKLAMTWDGEWNGCKVTCREPEAHVHHWHSPSCFWDLSTSLPLQLCARDLGLQSKAPCLSALPFCLTVLKAPGTSPSKDPDG